MKVQHKIIPIWQLWIETSEGGNMYCNHSSRNLDDVRRLYRMHRSLGSEKKMEIRYCRIPKLRRKMEIAA